jgi:NAD(P)H-hydrate epimerase
MPSNVDENHPPQAWDADTKRRFDVPRLLARPSDSHKGTYGHAIVVGGSLGMSGAITIASSAALRCGAGLVTAAVPQCVQGLVAASQPCAMTCGLEELPEFGLSERAIEQVLAFQKPGAVLGIGPGLGRSSGNVRLVLRLLLEWQQTAVIDADALYALSTIPNGPEGLRPFRSEAHLRILTPHPGEWARICGVDASDTEGQRRAAIRTAKELGWIVVLKGHQTLVTNGEQIFLNPTGNPSLAVGGSGDTLLGMIVAMVCQGLSAWEGAILGVYLHGHAADLAQASLGTPSTLATDLIEYLPAAFRSLNAEPRSG